MKITGVETYLVHGRGWPRRPWVFVELHTDAGITGLGEASAQGADVIGGLEALASLVIGEDPFNVEALWEDMFTGALPPKVERLRERTGLGGGTYAARLGEIVAIEMALWDIIGKSLGVPVYKLLGGRCHERIRVYEKIGKRDPSDPASWARLAQRSLEFGYTAVKVGIPAPASINREASKAEFRDILRIMTAVKEAVSDDVDVAVDMESKWSIASALRLVKAFEEFDLLWIENPIPRTEGFYEILAPIKAASRTPICLGGVVNSGRFGFRDILNSHAADIIEPDLTISAGGILEMKKIAALADTYYVSVAPHNMHGPIATMATMQVATCIPNLLMVETHLDHESRLPSDVVWSERLLTEPIAQKDGFIEVPDKPGLGVELRKEAWGRYIFRPEDERAAMPL